jgi:putative peptidoglycan lipid II flippase
LSVILMNRFGLAGLVMASTAAIIAQTLLLGLALRRKLPHLQLAPLLPTIGKVLAAAGLMAVVVFAGRRIIESHLASVHGRAGVDIFVLIPAGIAVYGIGLWLLRIEGREDLVAILNRVFRRGVKPRPETQT